MVRQGSTSGNDRIENIMRVGREENELAVLVQVLRQKLASKQQLITPKKLKKYFVAPIWSLLLQERAAELELAERQ